MSMVTSPGCNAAPPEAVGAPPLELKAYAASDDMEVRTPGCDDDVAWPPLRAAFKLAYAASGDMWGDGAPCSVAVVAVVAVLARCKGVALGTSPLPGAEVRSEPLSCTWKDGVDV